MIMNLANRYSDLGRHDEALAAIEESVESLRDHDRLHPDPLLWEALGLWGARLNESDFADPIVRDEYQELVTIQQRDDWPTDGLRGSTASMVMTHYGLKLAETGDREAGAHWMNKAFTLQPKGTGPRLRAVGTQS